MADMEQMKIQIEKHREDIQQIEDEMTKHHAAITKLSEEKKKIQDQIENITGKTNEESDAAVTTTTAGNIATLGGSGNYAPKVGAVMKRIKKKKKNENAAIDYLNKLMG